MRLKTVWSQTATRSVVAASKGPMSLAAPSPSPGPTSPSLDSVITNLITVIVGLSAGLATLFLTIGGLLYLTAGGDPEQVAKAKKALFNAAIGYGIAILAPTLTLMLKGVVGQK
jgi:hypothetical protein